MDCLFLGGAGEGGGFLCANSDHSDYSHTLGSAHTVCECTIDAVAYIDISGRHAETVYDLSTQTCYLPALSQIFLLYLNFYVGNNNIL